MRLQEEKCPYTQSMARYRDHVGEYRVIHGFYGSAFRDFDGDESSRIFQCGCFCFSGREKKMQRFPEIACGPNIFPGFIALPVFKKKFRDGLSPFDGGSSRRSTDARPNVFLCARPVNAPGSYGLSSPHPGHVHSGMPVPAH